MYKYKRIKLSDGSTRDQHRLVMEAHLSRRLFPNEVVHHINEDKKDNRLENLEVMPIREHVQLHQKGKPGKPQKLTPGEVWRIRWLHQTGDSMRAIARKFRVDNHTVMSIIKGKTWGWLK